MPKYGIITICVLILIALVFGLMMGISYLQNDTSKANSNVRIYNNTMMDASSPGTEILYQKIVYKTFSVPYITDSLFVPAIEAATGLRASWAKNVNYEIEFTHSGKYIATGFKGYSWYTGGCLVIMINGAVCVELPKVEFPANIGGPGNPKDILLISIENKVHQKVAENQKTIIQHIKRCTQ